MGRYCHLCKPGYYGNPALEGCKICECPLSVPSNKWVYIIWYEYIIYIYIYHHHHDVQFAQISLTLSRHPSLSFIASGRSSRLHPVSVQSCIDKSLLAVLLLYVCMKRSIGECHLLVLPCSYIYIYIYICMYILCVLHW